MSNAKLVDPPQDKAKGTSCEPSDQTLLERFIARGDETAFAGLVRRHGHTVCNVCRRLLQEADADDAFQAVFLVLARKAASIRKGEAVGSWLYGVAYRIAMKARRSAARRQSHERQTAKASHSLEEPVDKAAARDLQRLLDDEVQRLPERYRTPFILCYLQGMSRAEAARELQCKEGTLSSRLGRACKILQGRLVRRGVTLSAALTAVALTANLVTAATPPILFHTTIKNALGWATGSADATVSPSAARLARDVVRGMAAARFRVALLLVLTMAIWLTGATLVTLALRRADVFDPDTFVAPPVPLGTRIDEQVLSVIFSPDGKKLVTAGGQPILPGQVQIWDVAGAKNLVTLRGIRSVRALAFAPDGRSFAAGDRDGQIKLRHEGSGEELAAVKGHDGDVTSLAYSPDGEELVSAGVDGTLKLWDVKGLREQRMFRGHTGMVTSVAFFRHRREIVSSGSDKTAIIWNADSGEKKFVLRGHGAAVESVAVSPDDKMVATAGRDRTIKLWNAATGTEEGILDEKEAAVHAVRFSADGKLLASARSDGKVRLWDVHTRKLVADVGKHTAAVWGLAFSRDGSLLASGSADKTARIWHVPTGGEAAKLITLSPFIQPIRAVAYATDGAVLAMATTDTRIQIRDAKTGDVLRVFSGHMGEVNCLVFSPAGRTLASGSSDASVRLWDLGSGKERVVINGHAGGVYAVAFTPHGKRLASAGRDKVVKVWDAASGRQLGSFPGHEDAVRALAYAPDGRTLASGSDDHTVKLWDIAGAANQPITLKGHTAAVRALVFAADGTLASASDDGSVRLWHAGEGKELVAFKGHTDAVLSLAITPSGRTLASGSRDKTVRVWDTGSGAVRGILKGHEGAVTALAVHPRGECLISGGDDTWLLRWKGAKEAAPAGEVPRRRPPANQEPVAELLEDDTAFLKTNLDKFPQDASMADRDERTHFSGACSLAVTDYQRFSPLLPDWNFEIAENPKPGQFRYLRFAWKRTEAPGIMLQLHVRGGIWHRYFAGQLTNWTREICAPSGTMTRVADEAPREWQVVTRDLFMDFGATTITGIALSALEGSGYAYFDHIYLGRSIADLDKVTARTKNVCNGDAPKDRPPANQEQVAELLEDDTAFLKANLDKFPQDASIADRDERTHFSGACSLAVTDYQRFSSRLPNWNYEIRENPKRGQFRYLRFAWKRAEAPGIMLQLHVRGNIWHRYFAGDLSNWTREICAPSGTMTRVADDPPRQWQVVTRDLFKDFGAMTVTGIGLSALEGSGCAYFDHIYLGQSIADLDEVTARMKNVADPEEDSMAWLITGGGVLLVLVGGCWYVWLRRRRRRPQAGADAAAGQERDAGGATFVCPDCSTKLKARAEIAGKKSKCPRCGAAVLVPAAEVATSSTHITENRQQPP